MNASIFFSISKLSLVNPRPLLKGYKITRESELIVTVNPINGLSK